MAGQLRQTICVSAKVVAEPSGAEFEAAAETLKLLADPTRLAIIWALLHGEHSVAALAEHVGVRPTAVSQHLAKLRLAGAVRTRRDGNRIFYVAENEHIERLASEALLQADHLVTGGRRHHAKRRSA
jgi:DNA-binding transcriptional ArsR family regulator